MTEQNWRRSLLCSFENVFSTKHASNRRAADAPSFQIGVLLWSSTTFSMSFRFHRSIRPSLSYRTHLTSDWLGFNDTFSKTYLFQTGSFDISIFHGTSPSHLQSCFTRVSDTTSRRRLRSSTSHRLDVPPFRLSTVDKRAFPVSSATVWNDLPLHVASAPSLAVFRQRLKTFLFSRSYKDTIIWLTCYC